MKKYRSKYSLVFVIRAIAYQIMSKIDFLLSSYEKGPIVLCYHSFRKSNNRYAVNKSDFENQINRILKYSHFINLKNIQISDFYKYDNSIVLTIDDGYKSVFDILPITKKYKIPVILFILADSKKANREELETDEELLSWDDIKLLQNEGWEIGCHSSTHPKFPALSKMQIEEEIISSKKIIEKRLGNKISFFAYPKGAFSNRIKQFVKLAGYKYAFSVLPGRITKKTDLYSIPRTIIDQTHSWYDFPALYSKSWLIFRRITKSIKLWERFLT